ncbi:MAG: hypothetical protein AB1529_00100 [Candidatus Micrarchaeota archaeon]
MSLMAPVALSMVGLILLLLGYRDYSVFSKIRDIPPSKARSTAAGLVELHGTAAQSGPLESHISHSPCVYSRLTLEKFSRFKKKWVGITIFERSAPFLISDESGSVLVDPRGADFDLSFHTQTYGAFMLSSGKAAKTRAEAMKELEKQKGEFSLGPVQDVVLSGSRAGMENEESAAAIILSLPPREEDERFGGFASAKALNDYILSDQKAAAGFRTLGAGEVRLIEQTIPAGSKLYVLGTAVPPQNPQEQLSLKKAGCILTISDSSERELASRKITRAIAYLAIGALALSFSVFLALILM